MQPIASPESAEIDWLPHMNSRFFFSPPKQRLAQASGNAILPIRSPSGA